MYKILAALVLLAGTPAYAAIAFDASADAGVVGTPVQWNHTVTGSNPLLTVCFQTQNGYTATAVTYNSVAMTKLYDDSTVNGGFGHKYMYYLLNPSTGTNQVSITLSGSSGYTYAVSASYTGVDTTTQPDATTTITSNTGTSITHAVTTVADNSMPINCVFQDNTTNGTMTAGAGTTLRGSGASGKYSYVYDSGTPKTPAGSASLVANTSSSNTMFSELASFCPSGGCGGGGGGGGGGSSSLGEATSTVDQSEQNIFNAFAVFFAGFLSVIWVFKRQR